MTRESEEAESFTLKAQSLMDESFRMFADAHEMWLWSLDAATPDERLRVFGRAVEQERLAIEKQREALELRRRAWLLRSEGLRRLKAVKHQLAG